MEAVTEFLKTLASRGVKLSADAGQLNCYVQNGALSSDLRQGIVKHKAAILALLEGRTKNQQLAVDRRSSRTAKRFELSHGQRGLYILQKINPEMTAYNLPLCLKISGKLDVEALRKAWDFAQDQHPILKARIREDEGKLYHHLENRCKTTIVEQPIAIVDHQQLIGFLRLRVKQPFDLEKGPLQRIELFALDNEERYLLVTIHHIIFDGVSAIVLLRSLFSNYQALRTGQPVAAREKAGYEEFVDWEEAMLASAEGSSHADYWQERLSGELPNIELFPELLRKLSPSFEGASLLETVPARLSRALRDFSRSHSILPSAVFLAAFQLLLHRYTNLDDIVVGMPVNVRPTQRFSDLVGYFINMVPLRTHCDDSIRLSEFLRGAQKTILDAVGHASYPFELMLDRLRTGHRTKNAVFQVNYAYQNFVSEASFASLCRQELDIQNVREIGPEGYSDLGLEIFEKDALFSVHVRYNPDVYPEQAIKRFGQHYLALLDSISQGNDRRLNEYVFIPASEQHKVLREFNDTRAAYPKDKCIHELFLERVSIDPGGIAAVFGEQSLSYGELSRRSRILALYLQSMGIKPESVVGLCLERSLEMMVGIMGVVYGGGAYLPLDPDYPDDRLRYMLQDSTAAILLTQKKFRDRLSAVAPKGVIVVCLDADWPLIEAHAASLEQAGVELSLEVRPQNTCYVIYTSGSTGKPKGVLIEHQALVNRIHWMQKSYRLAVGDVVLQKTPYTFDVSVWEFFWPMMAGASVVFAVPGGHRDVHYLESLIAKANVTTLHFVPSMFRAFLDLCRKRSTGVRRIFTSGEALDKTSVDCYRDRFPNATLHNLYGPTEAAIDVTAFDCSNLTFPFVPIGTPIDNIQIYILDPHNRPQPIGVPGELHIAGDGLARGYLNRPDLTGERFVSNPFEPGTRMYKTGDLACWLEDGNIQYLGRIDTQVKIRGFRIETDEIEACLNRHPHIQDCAVIARDQGGEKQLIAFYRAKETTETHLAEVPKEHLRAHLIQSLPDYMVPAAFVSVAAIPLSSNGKVDRRSLAAMEVALTSSRSYLAARNETEKQLVEIWGQLLDIAPATIGVNDNFFELGGHSLRAAQLIATVRLRFRVEVPLKHFFDNGSLAQLAQFVTSAKKGDVRSIPRINSSQLDRVPLSFAQERLWLISQLDPESPGYNLPGAVTVHGELDIDQLEEAFQLIIARHESLRTIFPSHEGQAYQRILDQVHFKLEHIDLTGNQDQGARDDKVRQLCRSEALTPFNLGSGPLIRGTVIKLAEDQHVVMANMHHIISDGWSIGVLINELRAIVTAFRQGRRPELPPLRIRYADYSVWQRNWLYQSGVLEQQLAYWERKLAGVPETLGLFTDFPRPAVQRFDGATHSFVLEPQLTGKLKQLTEQHGGTLFMILLAVVKSLLYRYTGQSDICVGTPIANRQYGETDDVIGMFVNTLALRTPIEPEDNLVTLLSKVKTTCVEAYEHSDAPFEKVVELLHPQRNLAVSPLFQVMVILQNVEIGKPDADVDPYPVDSCISKFDLTFEFTENRGAINGSIEYSTALYKPGTIERMAGHLIGLFRTITAAPTTQIRYLEFLSETESHRLLVEFNRTDAAGPDDRCLHQLFVEQIDSHSSDTAVICGEERLSYLELYERSYGLALYLQSEGVEPECLVGLCMERSLDMLVGLLAILQAGGAYVPLDPDYPLERLAYMLRDSRTTLVLTQTKLLQKFRDVMPIDGRLLAMDGQRVQICDRIAELKAANVRLKNKVRPHHLAYVIYTSGSTGQPKGVAIEHHSPVTLVKWASEVYSRRELAGVLASTSVCFDLSVFEIFVTLANGGTIVLAPNALALGELPDRESVTLINTVPSAMEELLRLEAVPNTVQTVNLAGEPLSPLLVDKIYETTSVMKVYDLYGPSEDTTYSTFALRERHAPASIGRPISNTQAYILDSHRNLQPIGVPGELHIAGDGLAREYLHRPELTKERFAMNPFDPGTRMYRTGDVARWLEDGTLQYLGRSDTQIKIRGFRVEAGEIEARLLEHARIQDCAVVAQGQGANKQLVAFYRAKDTQPGRIIQLAIQELRAYLLKTLPDFMVPAAFVSLPAIPLTQNGKVDRRALSQMDVTTAAGEKYIAPRSDTERRLAAIWGDVLNRPPDSIGVHDNFFELGGHSLLATRMIAKLRNQLGTELPLKVAFERPTVSQLAELIPTVEANKNPAIRPADRAQFKRLPLSFAQERLWFINQLEPDSPAYNLPEAVTIIGELNVDQLENAFNVIIARHENLRTVFPSEDGEAQQRVLDRLDFRLQRIDLSSYKDRGARENYAKQLCQTEAVTLFDLAEGPLVRGKVIKLDEHEHILLLNMHHIISDGWSFGVLIKELRLILQAFSQGRSPELVPLPIQYADFSIWQRRWLEEGGILKQQLGYWRQKLAGAPDSLDLPTDYPRPGVQNVAGATHSFKLDAPLTEELKRLAEQFSGTLYMVLLTILKVLLHRYSGQNDICVGSPIANRQHSETENLIGMFVNTLVLRTEIDGEDTIAALLSKVRTTCLEAYEHQNAPFEKIVEALRLQRHLMISPLFQVMMILQNVDLSVMDGPGIRRCRLESGVSKFDLTFEFTEAPDGLSGSIHYRTALYQRQTIDRMARHFISLCRAITSRTTIKIKELDYIDDEEKQLLQHFNGSPSDTWKEQCLHQLFLERLEGNESKTAVVCGDAHLTYRQLHQRSCDLALYLQAEGVQPDSLVGLCVDRSLDMVVGLIGILYSGGAYVPLDPDYPDERIAYMVKDSHATIVLTQERLRNKLSAFLPADTQVFSIDSQWPMIAQRAADLKAKHVQLRHEARPHHLAYVMYTSGSTGKPKGVMVEHRNIVSYVTAIQDALQFPEGSSFALASTFAADLGNTVLFPSLLSGGTLHLLSRETVTDADSYDSYCRANRIDCVKITPSHLLALIAERGETYLIPARTLVLGGEVLTARVVDMIRKVNHECRIYNHYGPTECSVGVLCGEVGGGMNGARHSIPLGSPLKGTRIYILDVQGQPVPIGIAGELYIGGLQVARGYLNQPEFTAERFVPDRFNPERPGAVMYRTGDLAKWLADGTVEFLGRNDFQLKIRGFRVELQEIEAQLSLHPAVIHAAVIAREDEPGGKRLIGYLTATRKLRVDELRSFLMAWMPEYMVPAAFVQLDTMPLTANGKIDRRLLPELQTAAYADKEYEPPQGEIEETLARLWQEVLRVERVGRNGNFFELGGHSLSAVQLTAKIRRHFQQSFPLAALFTAPDVAAFAKLISSGEPPEFDILVPIQTNGDAPPVFALPGAGGNVLSLRPLSKLLGGQQPLYALQAVGLDGETSPLNSVEQTAQANIAALKKRQRHGPYRLIGHSYGGVVAYEMARILLEQREEVSSLILLDSIAPSISQKHVAHDESADLAQATLALADLYGQELEIDSESLRGVADDQRLQHLLRLLNARGLEINSDQFATFYRVYRANSLCYRSYTPIPLARNIEVWLYRATQPLDRAAWPLDYGWNELLPSPIRVVDVVADHFSILKTAPISLSQK